MKRTAFLPLFDSKLTSFQKTVHLLFSFCVFYLFILGCYHGSQVHDHIVRLILFYIPVQALMLCFLCCRLIRVMPCISKSPMQSSQEKQKYPWRLFFYSSAFLCGIIIHYHALGVDGANQWHQVLSGRFNDWHPVTHTFIIWLVTCFFRNFLFFLLVQGIFYVFLTGLLWKALVNDCKIRQSFSILSVLFLALFPVIHLYLSFIDKDGMMMVMFFGISIFMISIATSQGAWLASLGNTVLFAAFILIGTLVRHNGFFFTLPLLVCLPFVCRRKNWVHCLRLFLLSLLIFVPIKFFLIPRFSTPTGNPEVNQYFSEAIGIPMSVMTYIYTRYPPVELSSDLVDFMASLTTREEWMNYTRNYDLNTVKFSIPQYETKLAHFGQKKFFALFLKTIRSHPCLALSGFLRNIIWPWKPLNLPGFCFYAIMFTAMVVFPYIKWRVIPFVVPVLAYHAGTSLLLYGHDYRFFLYLDAIALPFLWTMTHLTFVETHGTGKNSPSSPDTEGEK